MLIQAMDDATRAKVKMALVSDLWDHVEVSFLDFSS